MYRSGPFEKATFARVECNILFPRYTFALCIEVGDAAHWQSCASDPSRISNDASGTKQRELVRASTCSALSLLERQTLYALHPHDEHVTNACSRSVPTKSIKMHSSAHTRSISEERKEKKKNKKKANESAALVKFTARGWAQSFVAQVNV